MAKPGGKAGGKRKDKRADQDKDEKRAKPGKAPKPGRPGKGAALAADGAAPASASVTAPTAPKASKPSKPKPSKGRTQMLVEQVAEEIVMAEYDRAVNGAAARESAEPVAVAVAVAEQKKSSAKAVAEPKSTAKAVAGEKPAAKAVAERKSAAKVVAGQKSAAEAVVEQKPAAKAASARKRSAKAVAVTEPTARAGGEAGQVGGNEAAGGEAAGGAVVGIAAGAEVDEAADGPLSELLRLPAGPVDLAAFDTAATPGVFSREKAEAQLPRLAASLGDLQERLFAAARGGDSNRRVLLVLQGMDTSGKGGTVRHVVGQLDPNGIRVAAFKTPTEEERAHDFLWRIRNVLPKAGEVGIFDRSHYEDVLIARVHKLALPMVIGKRYQLINRFEQGLVGDGTVLIKCFLHISPDEQRRRLLTRLDDPTKHWKYNPTDVDERALWPEYQEAYRLALEKCSTDDAPWYVIPADHKWYRNYAITRLLLEALERIDPVYPPGAFDVEVERKRLLAG